MRLKLDRLINIKLKRNETITVPNGELWKVTMYMSPNNTFKIEGNPLGYDPNALTGLVSAGTTITGYEGAPTIKGIAFKVVKEE